MKKWLALCLCFATLLCALASCGKKDEAENTDPTPEAEETIDLSTTVMSTENCEVSLAMLSYYFHINYQNFLSQHGDMLTYFSLDTSKSLKEQPFGGDGSADIFYYDKLFLGEHDGDWFDYFMDQTVASISSILVYCEAAHEKAILLTKDDRVQIDEKINTLATTAKTYGYTTDEYISATYGEGVKEADVRRAMEYSALASKTMPVLLQELSDRITVADVEAAYAKDMPHYTMADVSYYTYEVDYFDAKNLAWEKCDNFYELGQEEREALIAQAYEELIAEAEADARNIIEATSVEEVNKFILSRIAEKELERRWHIDDDTAVSDNETLIKAILIGETAQEILYGKTETSFDAKNHVILNSLPLSEETKTRINEIQKSLFQNTLSQANNYIHVDMTWVNDAIFSWIYEEGRADGDTKLIVHEKKQYEGSNVPNTNNITSHKFSACYLAKAPYRDESKTKNVAYMLFTDEDLAKAAINVLMERSVSESEEFLAIANEMDAVAYTYLENYVKGSLASDVFDVWVFSDELTAGTFTSVPLDLLADKDIGLGDLTIGGSLAGGSAIVIKPNMSTVGGFKPMIPETDKVGNGTFCVALYCGEGDETWYVNVKNNILTEKYDATVETMTKTYSVSVQKELLNQISA